MEHRCLLAQSSMFDTSQSLAPDSFFRVLVFEPLQSKDDNRLPFQIHKKEDLVSVVVQGLHSPPQQ